MRAKNDDTLQTGNFDDDVDSARTKLEASLKGESEFDDLAALQALAPILETKINSRRLSFALGEEDDDDTQIAVIHANRYLDFDFPERHLQQLPPFFVKPQPFCRDIEIVIDDMDRRDRR